MRRRARQPCLERRSLGTVTAHTFQRDSGPLIIPVAGAMFFRSLPFKRRGWRQL